MGLLVTPILPPFDLLGEDGRIRPHRFWENFGNTRENEKNVTVKNEFDCFNQRNFLHFLAYSLKKIFSVDFFWQAKKNFDEDQN